MEIIKNIKKAEEEAEKIIQNSHKISANILLETENKIKSMKDKAFEIEKEIEKELSNKNDIKAEEELNRLKEQQKIDVLKIKNLIVKNEKKIRELIIKEILK
jgi:V/A-type H+-transporting ATPase subunit G/H